MTDTKIQPLPASENKANPNGYVRGYSFTDFQTSSPKSPLPGNRVDEELDNISQASSEAVEAIKDVRRSDGALVNGIVTVDSLSDAVKALIGSVDWIDTVGENIESVKTVATSIEDVKTVSGDIEDVKTVAGISADVTAVAGVSQEVSKVAAITEDVTKVAAITGDVTTVASIADKVTVVAHNVDAVKDFEARYLGPKSSPPTTRNDGSPLQEGDLYFNTATQKQYVYTTSLWIETNNAVLSANSKRFTGDGTTTAFTLDRYVYSANYVLVWLDGVHKAPFVDYTASNDILTFTDAPASGALIDTLVVVTTEPATPGSVPDSRKINTDSSLKGGGDLTQDLTLGLSGYNAGLLSQFTRFGFPVWESGVSYSKDSVVRSNRGAAVYQSMKDNNTDPLTNAVSWLRLFLGGIAGEIRMFAAGAVSPGWVECNGQAISRTDNPNLFNTIGTTYGAGDGSTTFNVPDLRGEFPRGWDHDRGVDTGRTLGSRQGDAMRNIYGTFVAYGFGNGEYSGAFGLSGRVYDNTIQAGASRDYNLIRMQLGIDKLGIPIAAEIRPRNIALMFAIKT